MNEPNIVPLKILDEIQNAIALVIDERINQIRKWGDQNHDPQTYLAILTEEVGEFATEANDARWKHTSDPERSECLKRMRVEAVQVAAVALAIVECLGRGKWKWPTVTQPSQEHDGSR